MKNKKYLFISCAALLAVLLSACAGAAVDTSSAQADQAQSAPGVEASLNTNNANQPAANIAQDSRPNNDLTIAAEALGVSVDELRQALMDSIPADCASNNTQTDQNGQAGQNGQPGRDPNCRLDLSVAAATLGVTEEELQAALESERQAEREQKLTAAAETLGVTVDELQQALDAARPAECADQTQPVQGVDCRPDFEAVATTLGVTVEELNAALGHQGPDFAAAAETLGVTEEELQQALEDAKPADCTTTDGAPKDPNCRPDLETVATTLGVTVDQLQQALGGPDGGKHGPRGDQQAPQDGQQAPQGGQQNGQPPAGGPQGGGQPPAGGQQQPPAQP